MRKDGSVYLKKILKFQPIPILHVKKMDLLANIPSTSNCPPTPVGWN